jgi:hypothetical protein
MRYSHKPYIKQIEPLDSWKRLIRPQSRTKRPTVLMFQENGWLFGFVWRKVVAGVSVLAPLTLAVREWHTYRQTIHCCGYNFHLTSTIRNTPSPHLLGYMEFKHSLICSQESPSQDYLIQVKAHILFSLWPIWSQSYFLTRPYLITLLP